MRSYFCRIILHRGQYGHSFCSVRMKSVFVSLLHFLTKTFSPAEITWVRKVTEAGEMRHSEAVQESSPLLAALLALTGTSVNFMNRILICKSWWSCRKKRLLVSEMCWHMMMKNTLMQKITNKYAAFNHCSYSGKHKQKKWNTSNGLGFYMQ